MEAVPKLPLISFELKASPENTHFGPKLKHYIAEAYREDPDSYNNEIHQLEGLRSTAVRPTMDSAGLSALTRYFCQLRSMQSRFPMVKGQPVAVSFAWKDIYANMSCTLPDIRFEMACILYNIGALHTQLGASEPRSSPESLKSACTHFQNAAWAFQYIREQYPQPPGVDMSSDIMRLFEEICFAQAQECILEKSIQDTRKPSVVGAVATQVMFFYKNSLAHLGPSMGVDNVHEIIGTKLYNYWHRYLSFKMSYIGCIVCLYQGMHAEEQQKMGERVAFYQHAVERLGEANKVAKYIEPVQITREAITFTNDVVEGKRKAAKNENEFIYHEEVPDKDLLTDLKPVCLVKALPINFNDPEISGPDIFSRLVPMGAHEASSLYSEEKAKLLRQIAGQADAKTTELTEFMSSLQLDQLDVLDVEQRIPQEIVDRCAAMSAKADVTQALVDSMNNLAEIISDVEHSLAEIKNLIQEETMKEKEYQKVIGPRPPSIVQTELSREYHKYQEAHTRTNESNQVLHKAMTLHIANLKLLSQPLDVLQNKIPSIDNIEGLDRETMLEMKRVVGKAREMQTQRDSLIEQLREAINSDDITAQLLARSAEPSEVIFKQELEKHTPKVKIIEQNLAAQENIINRLTSLYASYGESRRLLSDVLRKRDGLINALITSYDTYEELLGKSQKGLEFYKKLSHNVNQLLTRLRSTCQVQEEERAQLLAKQTKAPTPTPAPVAPSPTPKPTEPTHLPTPPVGGTLRLKDCLPYMKNRGAARSARPQAQIDSVIPDTYYPESIYPTSVRPAPVGSEATDPAQMQLPDGVIIPQMHNPNQYNRYTSPYENPYSVPGYNYKGYDKLDDNYGYSTPYTPPQFSTAIAEPQYSNPYYSGTQNNGTLVTDSQNIQYNNMGQQNVNQYNFNDPYGQSSQINPMANVNTNHGVNPMGGNPVGGNPMDVNPMSSNAINVNPMTSNPMNVNAVGGNQMGANPMSGNAMGVNPMSANNMGVNPMSGNNMGVNPMSGNVMGVNPMASIPEAASSIPYNTANINQTDLNTNFAQMQVSVPKSEPTMNYGTEYSQTFYSAQYPNASNPNMATYSHAAQSSATNMVSSQIPAEYSSLNYPYSNESTQNVNPVSSQQNTAYSDSGTQVSNPYSSPQFNYGSAYENMSQGYTIYTNAESTMTSTTSVANAPLATPAIENPYNFSAQSDPNYNPALAQLDAMDQPIKSHVTGDALSDITYSSTFQTYDNKPTLLEPEPSQYNEQYPSTSQNFTNTQTSFSNQPTNVNYAQTYQNHPGYSFNAATGSYEYDYGSQNSYSEYSAQSVESAPQSQNSWAHQVYTNAGARDTVQSPSEAPQTPHVDTNNQVYYNAPYGYLTSNNQISEVTPNSTPESTNYGASVNQSTYMHSGQQNTNVTFASNQENVTEPFQNYQNQQPNVNQIPDNQNQVVSNQPSNQTEYNTNQPVQPEPPKETQYSAPDPPKVDTKPEIAEQKSIPSSFDLLSDIDFSVEHTPLMPEIKVPQISENLIIKPVIQKVEPVKKVVPKEEVIERPAKVDLFSDASLINKFTQEVKNLQKLVDSLTNKTPGGLTVLDSKWKNFQDVQARENMTRSKTIAMQHCEGNMVTAVIPFDDSRLKLKSDPDAYVNASYYKQLAAWCIPLVISSNPTEDEYGPFWKAIVDNKISCVVCLLSEVEMQGKAYFPTAKGQSLDLSGGFKVTLEDVACTVHWTERKLAVSCGKTVLNVVTHYQINVFPAKIVCSPLVLLADKILTQTYDNRLSNQLCGALIQCSTGAGRSAVIALLIMVMCQVRAGQLDLCDMMDSGSINLLKHRSNVLEDTKFLADAYRTALFYVQGVLCSGTTMFNGEAVSVPSGASILPPPASAPPSQQNKNKFSRESFEEMKQSPGLKSGDMKDPLNFLDPLWSLKKK